MLRVLGDLCAKVPDFATLEARFELFGFLVAEVRTVAELADTPWAAERGVFTEVEPGARWPAAPFRSDRAPSAYAARRPVWPNTPVKCSPSASGSTTTRSTRSRPTA